MIHTIRSCLFIYMLVFPFSDVRMQGNPAISVHDTPVATHSADLDHALPLILDADLWLSWPAAAVMTPAMACEATFTWELPVSLEECPVISLEFLDLQGVRRLEIRDIAEPPMNSWISGQTIKYTIPFWFPETMPPGTYSTSVGLIFPETHRQVLFLQSGKTVNRFQTGPVELEKPPLLHERTIHRPQFRFGAYPFENDDERNIPYQWIGPSAQATFPNPGSDIKLYMECSRPLPGEQNEFQCFINGVLIDQAELTIFPHRKLLHIPLALFASSENIVFDFISSGALVPLDYALGNDTRLLSFRLYHFNVWNDTEQK